MKLSALFAKYLYQHKQLNLPGIGTFTIDPSVVIPDPSDKASSDFIQQVRYTQKPVNTADDEFIDFIRTETGKIRPLAESDLDSFLSDGKILLNIGKPFHIEGIGSLQKNKAGQYEFTPGLPVLSRMESFNHDTSEDGQRKRPVFNEDNSQGTGIRKLLVAFGVVAGIVLVIWGGYSLYNRNTTSIPATLNTDSIAIAPSDTSRANIILDSVQRIIDSTVNQSTINQQSSAGTYKFIIERTSNKPRALKRFKQLKDNLTSIKMEPSSDSTAFSLYFEIPATPSDTTRIKDSLKVWYGRKEVYIEK